MILLQAGEINLWYKYDHPQEIIQTSDLGDIPRLIERIESMVEEQGLFAVGFISYEAAPAFDSALSCHPPMEGLPLMYFELHGSFLQGPLHHLLDQELPFMDNFPPDSWKPLISPQEYQDSIHEIHRYLKQGDSYQVNYTMPLKGPGLSSSREAQLSFFQRILQAQQCRYASWMDIGDQQVLSFSPELFFHQQGKKITCRPMKGTSPRGNGPQEDRTQANDLVHSEKDRAENLMILDMIRNDLGRIAKSGSVKVEEMFHLEAYPTVFQMVSQASCETKASLLQIFQALFPCASITGAPKVRTMEIIKQLEPHARGIYTGSMGYIHPGRKRQFNVAIRRLVNWGDYSSYSVGGGVVWDSSQQGEYAEALLKSRIINGPLPEFELLETLLWTPEQGFFLLEEHLERLSWSAEFFGFTFHRAQMIEDLRELEKTFLEQALRIRITLNARGESEIQYGELPEKNEGTFALCPMAMDSKNPLLYHKTTWREPYNMRQQESADFTLLHNEMAELTEFTIGNLVLQLQGKLYTPPVSSGLLPGVFRQELLKEQTIKQRVLYLEDLKAAEAVYLINSLRRWVPVSPLERCKL
ncbi:MAG: aminodeoxychorismate synthase component I [Spirochaetaceae bacterium]|jgi:para-aminobenzoate synthetase/4-amino-4-deoxychorismate lyase|nr:aminodeoxychorismate synthase component I [Spirochaetaceae bacterium]